VGLVYYIIAGLELRVEERLRHQIAVGLHDYIGENPAILKIKMESLAQSLPYSEFDDTIIEVIKLLSSTIESTCSLAFELKSFNIL
jgi:hypothetical protein